MQFYQEQVPQKRNLNNDKKAAYEREKGACNLCAGATAHQISSN